MAGPVGTKKPRLLENGLHRCDLQVRRVAAFVQDAFHHHPDPRPRATHWERVGVRVSPASSPGASGGLACRSEAKEAPCPTIHPCGAMDLLSMNSDQSAVMPRTND